MIRRAHGEQVRLALVLPGRIVPEFADNADRGEDAARSLRAEPILL
jgi:hypothetical protein